MEDFFLRISGFTAVFLLLSTPFWICCNLRRIYRRYKLNQANKLDLTFQLIALLSSLIPLIIGIAIGILVKSENIETFLSEQ